MKKSLLFVFIFIIMLFIKLSLVSADNDGEWAAVKIASGASYEFTTIDGEIIKIEKKYKKKEYRISLSDIKYLSLDFNDYDISFLKFYESTSYYILYGAIYENYEINSNTTIPYIVRFDKNLDSIEYLYDRREEVNGMAHFYSMIEFGYDTLLVTEFYDGEYKPCSFYGLYRLNKINENFEIVKTVDCGQEETAISIAYDTIDVKNSIGAHYYFDSDFNMLETYAKEMEYDGYMELLSDVYIDDILHYTGSIFSDPGYYTITDKVHEERKITINPIITLNGNKEGDYFKDYVEFKVSGGIVSVNKESAYLSGIISKPGKYTIHIDGKNGYVYEEEFVIKPKLLSTITDNIMNIGDTIEFTGEAKLNDTIISSGYKISSGGDYYLYLMCDNEVYDTFFFIVSEEEVTKEENNRLFIVLLSVSIVLLLCIIFIVIKRKIKKKKLRDSILNNN